MSPEEICPTSDSKQFLGYIKEVYSLKFDEEPNYNKLNFLLAKILMNNNQIPDNVFEWNMNLNLNPMLLDNFSYEKKPEDEGDH